MNTVEHLTWKCLKAAMQEVDPGCIGWGIDAGLGHDDYYCEWIKALGYPVIAVEPLPTSKAQQACDEHQIPLLSMALAGHTGKARMWISHERDLRSLDGTLWGGMTAGAEVPAVTVEAILKMFQITELTVLKLDIEGAEPEVLETIPDLPPAQRPKLIAFEWGGEHARHTERGPWQPAQQQRLIAAHEGLYDLGYRSGVMFGAGKATLMRPIAERLIFHPNDTWGNAIVSLDNISQGQLMEWGIL